MATEIDNNKITVSAKYVTKQYDLAEKQSDKVKSIFKFWSKGIPHFWSVKGVSFEAHAGETIGIIGTNGSGKSTLLEMVAGLIPPTTGEMKTYGTTSMIAIGSGLRPRLTGRANIRLKSLMQGMTEKEIDEKMDDIIEFSELGDFIDQPVKSYSSGMRSKLGFAISVYSDADIIIIDEALSVGDPTFTEKSMERTQRFKEEGKTIFFVSHSAGQVKKMAERVIWMHYGQIRMDGPADEVLPEYNAFLKRFNQLSDSERLAYQKRYKDAQKAFSLKKLITRERNRNFLLDINADDHELKENIYFKEPDERMSWFTRIILIVIGAFVLLQMDMSILDLTSKQVMANPTSLITNYAPSKLQELDIKMGRINVANKPDKPAITAKKTVNQYKVGSNETLAQISKKVNISIDAIMGANHMQTDEVSPGQILILPVER